MESKNQSNSSQGNTSVQDAEEQRNQQQEILRAMVGDQRKMKQYDEPYKQNTANVSGDDAKYSEEENKRLERGDSRQDSIQVNQARQEARRGLAN
jgi:hypothetical protein